MLLALALALSCSFSASAAASAVASADGQHCAALQRESGCLERCVVPHTRPVSLVWGAAPARAAAALLRAALLAAGHDARDVTLVRLPASARLCSLLAASDNLTHGEERAVLVALAAAWSPRERCGWGARSLRPHGRGAAPAWPRLHVRLAAERAAQPECAGADSWPFYRDDEQLTLCGFLPPGAEGSENATVFVIADEWKNETATLLASLGEARLRVASLSRVELARHVAAPKHSFLFLDAELWREEAGVRPGPAPARPGPAPAPPDVSLRVVDEYAMHVQAPELYGTLDVFEPSERDLRRVLERPAHLSFEEAACELAAGDDAPAGFCNWRKAAMKPALLYMFAFICVTESNDTRAYNKAIEVAGDEIYRSTDAIKLAITLDLEWIDCSDSGWLISKLIEWDHLGKLAVTLGAVVPAEAARAAASHAAQVRLPLVAYEAAEPAAASAAGGLARLAAALRRLLGACGWRRLGVVSDGTRRAAALARAVGAALVVREANASAPEEAERAVRELVGRDARVFLLNTGPETAAWALAAAHSLDLTPEAGYVWIVWEYKAADEATAALRPLSVSYQWRGGRPGDPPGRNRTRLHSELERNWTGRAWPRHAVPIMDGFFTLAEGYKQLLKLHPEMRDYPPKKDKLRLLWETIRKNKIQGVIEELTYDVFGVKEARVFVDQWDEQPRPRRLATWHAGEAGEAGEACPVAEPPSDGTARCLAPTGDAFQPHCLDGTWAGAAVALALAGAALVAGARAARRALVRRDRRREVEVYSRVLARRKRAFSALAPHLVDRALLELREELGAGRFGLVRLGVLRAAPRDRPHVVAAKALRENASPAEEAQFLREACVLAALEHEHIVRFVGVCIADGPPLLLMEHAFFGDLLRYLRARRHLAEGAGADESAGRGEAVGREEAAYVSAEALTRLAHEAAAALAHLARRGVVHRDVRAANCLVDGRRALKLADFGLARETGAVDGEYACRGRALFPVLWMAPESLARGVASAASDAWAFGVLALELVTLGARPYGAASPPSVYRAVLAGGRPPLPRDASPETRALTLACWRRDPESRPTPARLAAWLGERRRALRPALATDWDELDCDSGLGEPLAAEADVPDAEVPLLDLQ